MPACPPCQGHKERKLDGRRQQQEMIVPGQARPPEVETNRPQRPFLASSFGRVPSIFIPGLCVHDNSLVMCLHQRGSFQSPAHPSPSSFTQAEEARGDQSSRGGYSCSGWLADRGPIPSVPWTSISPSLSTCASSRRTVSETCLVSWTGRLPIATSSRTTGCFSTFTCSSRTGTR
jgi:hypothetical protein